MTLNEIEDDKIKIPITMCHGVSENLGIDRFDQYFKIAKDSGFSSINYFELEDWLLNEKNLPKKPIIFDFDHPVRSIYTEIFPLMKKYGFKGNLFVNTEPMEEMYANGSFRSDDRLYMIWDEIKELIDDGWSFGAHTHTHPNLSELADKDPSGGAIQQELELNDRTLEKGLAMQPRYFAFTGTSWSSLAEQEVMKRYTLGRLWIMDSHYQVDGELLRFADLVGDEGEDEIDGGPPMASRYITKHTNPFKIPSVDFEGLIYDYEDFRRYLRIDRVRGR